MSVPSFHPPKPSSGRLHDLWDSEVRELVEVRNPSLKPEQKERHTLYCLLVMSLVARYWNGNKYGRLGQYNWRNKQIRTGQGYQEGDYRGHNIACIAVNPRGRVIDFDFNHNELLGSSVEHAEARLVRRIFSLTQLPDWVAAPPESSLLPTHYSTALNDVTVYTSLESCSQCSGIMALGSVKEVVFLQRDPGQNSIGNILYNLSPVGGRYTSPLPIPADAFGLGAFSALDSAYTSFASGVGAQPFYTFTQGRAVTSPSITSFLCTDDALDIFEDGRQKLESMTSVSYPDYRPPSGKHSAYFREDPINLGDLTNLEVLDHVKNFGTYAVKCGRRGTPHQL